MQIFTILIFDISFSKIHFLNIILFCLNETLYYFLQKTEQVVFLQRSKDSCGMGITVLAQQISSKFLNLTLSCPSADLLGHYMCTAEKQHVL